MTLKRVVTGVIWGGGSWRIWSLWSPWSHPPPHKKQHKMQRSAAFAAFMNDDMMPAEFDAVFYAGLPGVGPKILALIAHTLYNVIHGVPLDRHVERFCIAHGWCCRYSATTKNKATIVEQVVPQEDWIRVNEVSAGIAQILKQTKGLEIEKKQAFVVDVLQVAQEHGMHEGMSQFLHFYV